MKNTVLITLVMVVIVISVAHIWAQRFMYRQPIPGVLLRIVLAAIFALVCGAAFAASSVSIDKAIVAVAVLAGIDYWLILIDALLIFDYETRTAEFTE